MIFKNNYTKADKNMDESSFDIANIPFVLHKTFIKNHHAELSTLIERTPCNKIQKELNKIKQHLKVLTGSGQKYLKTQQAAALINVSTSFLQKNMQGTFQERKHYFYPSNDVRLLRWDREELEKWIQGEAQDNEDKALIAKLLD